MNAALLSCRTKALRDAMLLLSLGLGSSLMCCCASLLLTLNIRNSTSLLLRPKSVWRRCSVQGCVQSGMGVWLRVGLTELSSFCRLAIQLGRGNFRYAAKD